MIEPRDRTAELGAALLADVGARAFGPAYMLAGYFAFAEIAREAGLVHTDNLDRNNDTRPPAPTHGSLVDVDRLAIELAVSMKNEAA